MEPKYILHGINEDLIVSDNKVTIESQGVRNQRCRRAGKRDKELYFHYLRAKQAG